MKAKNMTRMALCVALISVCAWIALPTSVPFTMQTFAVFLTLSLLGGKNGTLCIVAYLLLGAVGAPVFSGFRGGVGALLGTTGGYMVGFVAMGLVYWAAERLCRQRVWAQAAALALGLVLLYALGTAWFMTVSVRAGGKVSLHAVLALCVWPFVVPDLLKLALAMLAARRLKRRLGRG